MSLGVVDRPGWETVTALITVKAYPVIGSKTGEAVCVAGIRLDTPEPTWIRLFPVPFRQLAEDKRFKKFQIVQLRAQRRHGADRRPESLHPDLDSMRLGEVIDTQNGTWARRWSLLGDRAGEVTMCELLMGARTSGQASPSLGLVKPAEVTDVTVTTNPAYAPATQTVVEDLFGADTTPLQASPFIAKYRYKCLAVGCNGHHQTIVDWEVGMLGRRLLREGKDEAQAIAGIRAKYLGEMASAAKDVHFFVGNQHQHPASFLVIGVFWPGKNTRPATPLF